MSTSGAIARLTPEGAIEGRYHNWDSYPEGLGRALFTLRNGHFGGDTDAMLKVLIDDHPGGWSTIAGETAAATADFTKAPQWRSGASVANEPVCYCHGDEPHSGASTVTSLEMEYTYILRDATMQVYYYNRPIATVDLDGPEPDWAAVERGAVSV